MSTPQTYMSIRDVSKELSISIGKAHKLVQSGALPAVDVGGAGKSYWRIARDDFDSYITTQREATARRFRGGVA